MERDQIEKAIVGVLSETNIPLLAREISVLLNMKYPGNKFTKSQIKPIIWGKNLRQVVKFDPNTFKYFLTDLINKSDYQFDFTAKSIKSELLSTDTSSLIEFDKLKKILDEEELRISNPSIRLFIENVLFRLQND
jgi:hypothetical protein